MTITLDDGDIIEDRRMTERRQLGIINTDSPDALTDQQIRALKKLSPEQIEQLCMIAEVSRSVQLVIGLIVGIITVLSLLNLKVITGFIGKMFQ